MTTPITLTGAFLIVACCAAWFYLGYCVGKSRWGG